MAGYTRIEYTRSTQAGGMGASAAAAAPIMSVNRQASGNHFTRLRERAAADRVGSGNELSRR